MRRVLVVANKWWECDPALAAMLNDNTRPAASPWPSSLQPPRPRPRPDALPAENKNPTPRAVFRYQSFSAELWCISDLLEDLPSALQSSSSAKAARLRRIFDSGDKPELVIAVGTAGTCSETPNRNGSVAIGASVFMHNAHPNETNPSSTWTDGPFDRLIESSITPDRFSAIAAFDKASTLQHFLPVPLTPSASPDISAGPTNVSLGTLNVTDYREYKSADPVTVQAFQNLSAQAAPVSLETTHGLIRVQSESPFIFVSGITDRFMHFDDDVAPRSDAQNTAAAHNAGVTVAWLLANLDQRLSVAWDQFV